MNEPQHLSFFIPGALNELLVMIEKGEREREKDGQKKGVDSQLQFPFDLYTGEQEGESDPHNQKKENYNERTNCIN